MNAHHPVRASFGQRVRAYALDAFLALVPALAVFVFTGADGAGGPSPTSGGMPPVVDPEPFLDAGMRLFYLYCLFAVVTGSVEAVTGRSPGKYALGLELGGPDGPPAGPGVKAARAGLKYCPQLAFLLGWATGAGLFDLLGVGLAFLFFTGCFTAQSFTRATLHDMVLKTGVYVRSRARTGIGRAPKTGAGKRRRPSKTARP